MVQQVRDWHRKGITSKAQAEFATQQRPNWKKNRLLHAIASEATALLPMPTTENFDQAVNTALQIIGKVWILTHCGYREF